MEIGYLFLCLIFAKIGVPFRVFMLALAVFYVAPVSILIKKYSRILWLSYILFFLLGYFMFFTTIRQAVALACTMYSWILDKDGKKVPSVIFSVAACFMHLSALLFFLYYMASHIKWRRYYIVLAAVAIAVMQRYRIPLTQFLLKYVGKENLESMEAGGWTIILLFAIAVAIGLVYYKKLFKKNDDVLNQEMLSLFVMMVLALAVMPIGQYTSYFYRVRHYFAIYIIVYAPNVLYLLKKKLFVWLFIAYIIAYGSYVFFGINQDQQSTRTNPYVFFWQHYPDYIDVPSGGHDGKW